jgi:hypothetical protein
VDLNLVEHITLALQISEVERTLTHPIISEDGVTLTAQRHVFVCITLCLVVMRESANKLERRRLSSVRVIVLNGERRLNDGGRVVLKESNTGSRSSTKGGGPHARFERGIRDGRLGRTRSGAFFTCHLINGFCVRRTSARLRCVFHVPSATVLGAFGVTTILAATRVTKAIHDSK